jgi:copper(I)-binding protein
MKNRTLIVCLLLFVLTACVSTPQRGIEVSEATVRLLSSEMPAAGYMTIRNNGNTADRLVGVTSDDAQHLMLHQSSVDANGIASMKMVMSIDLPAGQQVELKPGSFHIVLSGLKEGLKAGDMVTLHLQFEQAGTIDVSAQVTE